jgi:hypothetical protein
MKGHIVSNVVSGIRDSASGIITTKVNLILNGLPSDIKVTNNIYMKYEFPVAPVIRNGYMFTGIVAYLHPANDPSPLPGPMRPIPEFDANNTRGIQFFVSDYIVRSAINSAFKLNLLTIKVNKKIGERQIAMTYKARSFLTLHSTMQSKQLPQVFAMLLLIMILHPNSSSLLPSNSSSKKKSRMPSSSSLVINLRFLNWTLR